MAKQLTIRGVSDQIGQRLARLSQEKGQSVNATVLELLESTLAIEPRRQRLRRYATWSKSDLAEFQEALTAQRQIDDELWS